MPAHGWSWAHGPLDFASLRHFYQTRQLSPMELVLAVFRRIRALDCPNIWISLVDENEALARARMLDEKARNHGAEALPLFGIPFAVKDNIDVAGMKTTAACRAFERLPEQSSPVVTKLLEAGAILIGKTNLDQFATGLTGLLSSFGPTRNIFNAEYIAGGSSSGSALAVSAGLVSFALGTDTAGSGRVPAAFNHLVGLKPTRGLMSTRGMFPACRSLDCVSLLTLNVPDAAELLTLCKGFDPADPYSRRAANDFDAGMLRMPVSRFRYGVPKPGQLDFFGDASAQRLFDEALRRLEHLSGMGAQRVEVDVSPFLETGRLLYQGPWIAERYASVEWFAGAHADALHPVTRGILERGKSPAGWEVFRGLHLLEGLRRRAEEAWAQMDLLVLPTAGRAFSIEEASADPAAASTKLGLYTNFVNLLDLCALALPAGFESHGVPWGISLLAPAFSEANLLAIGQRFYPDSAGGVDGASRPHRQPPISAIPDEPPPAADPAPRTLICVVGAHLSGQPLNHQLTELDGQLVKRTRTAPEYRLLALVGTKPAKPGLVRIGHNGQAVGAGVAGAAIEVEVWSIPEKKAGAFLSRIPSPMCLGTILLQNGETVKGFLCEPFATHGAEDISSFGGWLHYLAHKNAQPQ